MTFWPRLSPEAIDPVLCLGCFETGAIYTTFCLGSVRTEAKGDKYFSFHSNFRKLNYVLPMPNTRSHSAHNDSSFNPQVLLLKKPNLNACCHLQI